MKSIVIACGGTGGHISPGVAILEELLDRKSELDITSVILHSPKRNHDNPDLQNLTIPIIWHNLPQFTKWNFLVYPFLLLYELIRAYLSFRTYRITDIIGMGGYTSILSLLYARIFRVRYFLCEQNCVPGKITRYFAKGARKIACSFPVIQDLDSAEKSKVLGNPIRRSVIPKVPGLKTKIVSKKNPLNVLVLGGSQGARQINSMVLSAMETREVNEFFKFRMLTGTNLYEEVKSKSSSVEAISYSQDMRSHYEWADLVICRSGAGVIAECSAYGLPLILIPYPYAADNHQLANAEFYSSQGACILLDTKSHDGSILTDALMNLVQNPHSILELSKASLSLSSLNASRSTVDYFFL